MSEKILTLNGQCNKHHAQQTPKAKKHIFLKYFSEKKQKEFVKYFSEIVFEKFERHSTIPYQSKFSKYFSENYF